MSNPRMTAELLRSAGACAEQVDAFEALFPDGTEITVALAMQHAEVFDWDWARSLLSDAAWAEYDKIAAAAWAQAAVDHGLSA